MMVKAGKNNSLKAKEGFWYKVDSQCEDGFKIRVDGIPYFLYQDEVADYSFLNEPDYLSVWNEPHRITGGKHSTEKAPAKPLSVLLDIDIFRKGAQMIFDTSPCAHERHTVDSLESQLKRQTVELCESLKDILNNDPNYYGHCFIGTPNYRISFLWEDEDTVELDISIHPEMKDGMVVETDIESIMEQL